MQSKISTKPAKRFFPKKRKSTGIQIRIKRIATVTSLLSPYGVRSRWRAAIDRWLCLHPARLPDLCPGLEELRLWRSSFDTWCSWWFCVVVLSCGWMLVEWIDCNDEVYSRHLWNISFFHYYRTSSIDLLSLSTKNSDFRAAKLTV